MKTKDLHQQKYLGFLLDFFLVSGILSICFISLEYSCIYNFSEWSNFFNALNIKYIILNFTVLGTVWSFLLIICVHPWLASLLMSIICGVIAIINHYVLMLHGMPLSFLLIKNLSTAMAVISGYHLSLDSFVVRLLFIMVFLTACCLLARSLPFRNRQTGRKRFLSNILIASFFLVAFYFCYLSPTPLKPAKTITWHWLEGYGKYGYAACTVESYFQLQKTVNTPDGYSKEAVHQIEIEDVSIDHPQTPDVILILNESLYDLNQIMDIQTDKPYLQGVYNLDNLVSGYAVTPSVGGGTNSSEYELLTSNSLELMPGITPFNSISLKDANSIVSFMNSLGYYSIASHSAGPHNYSRGIAYPALGFEHSFFLDAYQDLEWYQNRAYTDKSSYTNLIRWYENAPADRPRFMYMLTYQNHGSYDQNDSEFDTVHIQGDYGDTTHLINEYLTSISMSDQAFCDLADYFSRSERPVIICMVGDHAPNFAQNIASGNYSEEELNLRLRKVPLLYWANFEMQESHFDTIGMNFVVPTLLELANIERSPYYNYMLQIRQDIPIISSYGRFFDVDGNMYHYTQDSDHPLKKLTDHYFFLEYYNIQSSRTDALFNPYS